MQLETLKLLKKHFELIKTQADLRNEYLNQIFNDKNFINKFKELLYWSLPEFELDEDIMDGVLIHHGISSKDKLYIDEGSWLVTGSDPRMLNCSLRYIKESDIEYVRDIISKNNNPLVYQTVVKQYYDLISGRTTQNIPQENQTIIKPPSLIIRESNIPSYKDNIGLDDWAKLGNATFDCNCNSSSILRAQFYLRVINENPDEVFEFYKDINNWKEIEENVQKYYVRKKQLKKEINAKLKNVN